MQAMIDAELQTRAEEEAALCRDKKNRDWACPFLIPRELAEREDCPLYPRQCGQVTAKAWLKAWAEVPEEEEMPSKDTPDKLLVVRDVVMDMQYICSWIQGDLTSQTARGHLDKAQGLLLRAAWCIAEAAEKEGANGASEESPQMGR